MIVCVCVCVCVYVCADIVRVPGLASFCLSLQAQTF